MKPTPIVDVDACYQAVVARDRSQDGRFVTAVRTTGIYCRPVCPARTPLRRNCTFFASPALAALVRNLLEVGDRFSYQPDVAAANALYDFVWARLVTANEWLEIADGTVYEFFDDQDPVTNWGRAYRYFGQGTFAGPVVPFTAGTYTRAGGGDLPALALQTWDGSRAEFLVLLDDDTVVHALQDTNGLPIVERFERR